MCFSDDSPKNYDSLYSLLTLLLLKRKDGNNVHRALRTGTVVAGGLLPS